MSETGRMRMLVPDYNVTFPVFSGTPPSGVVTESVQLQKYVGQFVRSMTADEAALPDGQREGIAQLLRAELGRKVGFLPDQVNYATEDEPYSVEIRPRWWEVLRRLHLRPRRTEPHVRRRYRAWCVAAIWADYEIERRAIAIP